MEQDPNQLNTTPEVAPQVINTPQVVTPPAQPTYQQDTTTPVVTNMSTNPALRTHSKRLVLVLTGVIVVGLIGLGSFSYLQNKRQTSARTTETLTTGAINKQQGSTNSKPDSNTGTPGQDNDTQSTQQTTPSTSTTNNSTGSNSATTKVYCGVNGMPEGVCTAIKSIEKDGLKNNPYVAADTSQVPEGSTVQIDESSWKTGSSEEGSINFTAVLGGKSYEGVGNLQIVDGVWKVVSYTLG